MFNKMCDIGVIPDNLVISSNENEKGYELNRNEEVFFLKDQGEDGYVIELENLAYWNEFSGYATVNFKCYDDFLSLLDVNTVLHFIYCENCGIGTLLRKDERMFYHELEKLEKYVEYRKEIKIEEDFCHEHVFFKFFEGIENFMREYEKGFKHGNKKIEKKFNVIAKKLKKITDLPPWLKY